jgi:hypothetical protein
MAIIDWVERRAPARGEDVDLSWDEIAAIVYQSPP